MATSIRTYRVMWRRSVCWRRLKINGLDNPNSVLQMREWLLGQGIKTESLDKKAVADLIPKVGDIASEVLSLRQKLSKSSVTKYQAMKTAVCTDGRIRGCFMFYGANRTGRFADRLVQLQNQKSIITTDICC